MILGDRKIVALQSIHFAGRHFIAPWSFGSYEMIKLHVLNDNASNTPLPPPSFLPFPVDILAPEAYVQGVSVHSEQPAESVILRPSVDYKWRMNVCRANRR